MHGDHLIGSLLDGPLDIIGDIHGELEALQDLLRVLEYRDNGEHPQGRRLVFIGDLCDRGRDSPGVIACVQRLVERGLAQCLLGNHELNLLRGSPKEGNGWFFTPDHDRDEGKFLASQPAGPASRDGVLRFIAGLPLVLEREDLRLVHAAWDAAAISLLRDCRAGTAVLYNAYADRAHAVARESGLAGQADRELRQHGSRLKDPAATLPLLEGIGRLEALNQMANPVRIVTSGPEALAQQPFFASGKWRMLDRVRWWERYTGQTPVMVGHYWRWPTPALRAAFSRGERDLFEGARYHEWHGVRRNAYCLDFGVGARYRERALGQSGTFQTRLGAVRWPEREVVTDDGSRLEMR